MAKQIRISGVRRKEIDEEKLALAFLLLARSLHKRALLDADTSDTQSQENTVSPDNREPESA
jgi:hypothetical protein